MSEKTMQDEANEEWTELALENIDKLIPKEWSQQINEVILPKILYFLKMGLKKGIKNSVDILGKDKYAVMCNLPVELKNGDIIWVPHYVKIDKSQLKSEFALKEGENPEAMVSYLDIYAKIDGYQNVKDIMTDIQNGSFLKGMVTGKEFSSEEQKELVEQKQIQTTTDEQK